MPCPSCGLEILPTQAKMILSVADDGTAVAVHLACVAPDACGNCGHDLAGHVPNRRLPGVAGKPDSAITRCRECGTCAYPVPA
jgi:hypothetical protein